MRTQVEAETLVETGSCGVYDWSNGGVFAAVDWFSQSFFLFLIWGGQVLAREFGSSQCETRTSLVRGLGVPVEEDWRRFVLIYQPLLRAWVVSKGVPQDAVQDVLQECFASVYHGINHFVINRNRTGAFRSWLRTITLRRIADYFRRQDGVAHLSAAALAELTEPEQLSPEELEAERVALQEVQARALHLIRQSISERTWQMFWRVAVERYSTKDVADEFGVSTAAVRVAKKRVMDKLKQFTLER